MTNLSRMETKILEVKNSISEKNSLAAFYSRLEITDKKNSKLKVRLAESIQFEVTRQKY